MKNVPIIIIALANENIDASKRLKKIEEEASLVKKCLQLSIDEGLCEIVIIHNTTIDKLLSTFREPEYKNRIAIFHYAGHADGYQLLLETEDGSNKKAHGEGLVSFLSRQDSLQLVFLNGCSTENHAEDLVNEGISAVIGTSTSISDGVAMSLAGRFYRSIGLGLDIKTSWDDAIDDVKISYDKEHWRSLDINKQNFINDRYPWSLYIREGAEQVNSWNLPDASKNPLFRLPKLDEKYYESMTYPPFRYLKYYRQEDAATFFGRGYEIRKLYESIQNNKSSVVLLYGRSGVGKSSLLNAGLIPYVEKDHEVLYLRRDESIGISQLFINSLLAISEDSNKLKEAYIRIESNLNKPLLVILDQIDEYETKPIKDKEDEIIELVNFLDELQGNIRGKIILSYRKEYHADIEKRLKDKKIAYSSVYLEPLNKDGIIEAVQGLEKNHRTREFYNYSVEGLNDGSGDDLASIIADDLLEDKSSPISSLLQIHLSKLWDMVKPSQGSEVKFTVKNYYSVGKTNLNDFFNEQIDSIKKEYPSFINSGLALEVLNNYTTEFGTAKSCGISTIEEEYQYFPDIRSVTNLLVNNYLLSKIDENSATLAHDTLGSIVLSHYTASDLPAQRAKRIISNKISNLDGDTLNVLDDHDLGEVETALKLGSVKVFNDEEATLFSNSVTAREKRQKATKRRKQLGFAAVATITSIAIIATYYYFRADQERTRAFDQINTANKLIDNIQGDLRDRLHTINRLDIMSGVQEAINNYHSDSRNIIQGTTNDIVINGERQNIRNRIDGADILFSKGESDKALDIFKASLTEATRNSALAPNDTKWKSMVSVIILKIANIHSQRKEYSIAHNYIKRSLEITNNLLLLEPKNPKFRQDLIAAYDLFGSVYSGILDYAQAINYFNMALQETDNLIKLEPTNDSYTELKITIFSRISSVYTIANDIRNMAKLIEQMDGKIDESSVSKDQMEIFKEINKKITYPCSEDCLSLALNGHLLSLSAIERLVQKNPNNNLFYKKAVILYQNVAGTYQSMGDGENAGKYYQLFEQHSSELLRRNPQHADHHHFVAQGYFSQANADREGYRFDLAKEKYAKGLLIIEELLKNDPNNKRLQQEFNGQYVIYNGIDASKQTYELLKENGINQ